MIDEREARKLASEFSDRSRQVKRTGGRFLVPLKYDKDGNTLTPQTFDVRKHLKTLNLNEMRFLDLWVQNGFDEAITAGKSLLNDEQAKRMFKKLNPFREEHNRLMARARIVAAEITPEVIKYKHWENVHTNELDDGQRDSLKELAKIVGVYKQQGVSITQNVFNLPPLSPDQEEKLRETFDAIAIEGEAA